MNCDLVERARSLAGIKGFVTTIDPAVMDGPAIVAAYHDLYQVERPFRTTKSDLAARPLLHRLQDSIQAHLTVVFAALAVSRQAQARSGPRSTESSRSSGLCAQPPSPSAPNR